MARKTNQAPRNYFNETDHTVLEELAGQLATQRLAELENAEQLSSFTAEDLFRVHEYILQDVYPWSGQLRTEEVGAMGMAMCRAEYVPEMLRGVIKAIEKTPPSAGDKEAAIATVADHWGEMTIVHPFRDGNSRTQRFFFDQLLRSAGWALDWTRINAEEVHAARYIAAATTDSRFLADALRPGVLAAAEVGRKADEVGCGASSGHRDARQSGSGGNDARGSAPTMKSAELFHLMRRFRAERPGESFHDHFFG
ncbi:Fic/DOC family protein [Corynebacterium resistens]|uniref:Fic/DOC family protein n=1 Tax=Corynebacterium resistens TaxID=258224 RepID=UPI002357E7F4|nr:Fic family protein [Corynebacterium resistens]